MQRVRVWDIVVRVTHWTIALLVIGEFTIFDEHWAIHRWAGYFVLGLIALRLLWGFVGPRYARFSAFPPSIARARAYAAELLAGRHPIYLTHNPLGALMAYNLWASLVVSVITGYLGILHYPGAGLMRDLHQLITSWLSISMFAHFGGVLFESWYSGINLTRAMITGEKQIPAAAAVADPPEQEATTVSS